MARNLLIAIYSHPEYYPPTLNALEYLSEAYDKIILVHRNITGFDWKYPDNVELFSPPGPLPVREAEKAPLSTKIRWFLQFTRIFGSLVKRYQPDTILIYDSMPLLSYRLLSLFIRKPRILWYHNHDVSEQRYLKKYSLAWWAWKAEQWVFPKLDIFTLPADERRANFPMKKFRGKYWLLPNFPSLRVIARIKQAEKDRRQLKILYQGSIGKEHGLEEIIPLLGHKFEGRGLTLVLKGFVNQDYLQSLQGLALKEQVADRLLYLPPGGYAGVLENAATCHIGIGIHRKQDEMNKTLGTASNKIYEAAALGMPVLLFDNGHFREHLSGFVWTFFTDCSAGSLFRCIESIAADFDRLSQKSRQDFLNGLNFENAFLSFMEELRQNGEGR